MLKVETEVNQQLSTIKHEETWGQGGKTEYIAKLHVRTFHYHIEQWQHFFFGIWPLQIFRIISAVSPVGIWYFYEDGKQVGK